MTLHQYVRLYTLVCIERLMHVNARCGIKHLMAVIKQFCKLRVPACSQKIVIYDTIQSPFLKIPAKCS